MARDGYDTNEDEANDPIMGRLMELGELTARAKPRFGIVRRVAARLDERHLRDQLTIVLTAAALAASVSLAFWWDATSRLTVATVTTAFDDAEGLEP
jgi:hypothetical protein